ncbi:MAG: shikimate kinase [Thermodesulfobacteriota bacterium]|nr:shikimate kinase [Thermodesulfobacteriota bacterium]
MSSFEKQNIFLIGFMGVGKTTVGRLLAKKIHSEFIDLDECVVGMAGCSISQIFDQQGEYVFRDLETMALSQLDQYGCAVVATGGGIIGRDENREIMQQLGLVVYLHADWSTLVDRLVDTSQRPLANSKTDENLYKLWQNRLPLYQQADVVVHTDNLTPKQVVDKIVSELTLYNI